MRAKCMATLSALVQCGASTAKRDGAHLGIGGLVLYELARSIFKNLSVSKKAPLREPFVVGISAPPATFAVTHISDSGDRAGEALVKFKDKNDGSECDARNDREVDAPSAAQTLAASEGWPRMETAAGDKRDCVKRN